jgi:low affinity Fe/Cu permease
MSGRSPIAHPASDAAGRPAGQIGVNLLCAGWFALGFPLERLSSCLSIAALFLTQMVLSQQRRENAALYVKIDELVIFMRGARDEVAGLE